MNLKDLVAEYQSLIEYLDLAEKNFGVYPTEAQMREVASLAKAIKALGGKA